VYQYYGYNLKTIKNAMLKNNILNITINFGVSIVISTIICVVVNYLNTLFNIVIYQIFTIDIFGIFILFSLLIILSIVMALFLYKNIKTKGWYSLVKNSGDLI